MALSKKCRHDRSQWRMCGCSWYWDGYIDGRRAYRNLGSDRTEARRLAAQIELDRLSGRAGRSPRDSTIEAVAERWLDHLESHGRRPQTLRAYRTAANAVEGYFGPSADVKRIGADDVADFEADAFARRRGHGGELLTQALRGILKQAHRERLIDAVPSPPSERREIPDNPGVRMTEAEIMATIAQMRPDHWRDMAEVILLTGLRVSEALALRWDDLDESAGTLRVDRSVEQRGRLDAPAKTRRSHRRLRIEPEVVMLLGRQPRDAERIFPRRYAAANSAMRRALERAGTSARDRGWHSLRHANTDLRNKARQSIRDAAAALGHGSHFAMTMAYGWNAETGDALELSKLRHPPSST